MRESGFYWVKYGGDWIVAEWYVNYWLITGEEHPIYVSEMGETGERIERKESK